MYIKNIKSESNSNYSWKSLLDILDQFRDESKKSNEQEFYLTTIEAIRPYKKYLLKTYFQWACGFIYHHWIKYSRLSDQSLSEIVERDQRFGGLQFTFTYGIKTARQLYEQYSDYKNIPEIIANKTSFSNVGDLLKALRNSQCQDKVENYPEPELPQTVTTSESSSSLYSSNTRPFFKVQELPSIHSLGLPGLPGKDDSCANRKRMRDDSINCYSNPA